MQTDSDTSEVVVLVFSLIIFIVTGYMGWSTRKYTKTKLLKEELPEAENDRNTLKSDYQKNRDRLETISDHLGWQYLFLQQDTSGKTATYKPYPELSSLNTSDRTDLAKNIMKAKQYPEERIKAVENNPDKATRFLTRYYKSLGYRAVHSFTSPKTMAEQLNHLSSVYRKETSDYSEAASLGQQSWEIENDKQGNAADYSIADEPKGTTLKQLLDAYQKTISTIKQQNKKLRKDIEQTSKEYYTFTEKFGDQQKIASLIEEEKEKIENRKSRIKSLREQLRSSQDKLVETLYESGVKKWELQQERQNKLDQYRRELEKKENVISEFQDRVDTLKKRKKQQQETDKDVVDGKLLHANQNVRTAFINIGKNDGLVSGITFNVFGFKKGGVKVQKGTVEVTRMFEDYSRVKIVEINDPTNEPMEEGDRIQSEDFNEQEQKVFSFIGFMPGSHNKSMFREIIERNGHLVDSKVTNRTTFLVVGKGYKDHPEFKKAKRLGVKIINPKQLKRMFDIE